jgi:RimJ/RimL family protein N-acetyltransferase/GNAT superfamily N-acetyltransferase
MTDLSGWTPRPRPERRALEGRYVRLEPLDAGRHGDALFEAGSRPEAERLWRYLSDGPFESRAAFEPWLANAAASADPQFFAAVERATGRAEGRLTFLRIEPTHGVIETGHILFGPRLARTPAATEAIYLQARHAFDDLGYRRFEWKCNDLNEPSKRAAIRFGFSFEGVFRQHMVVKGENRDTAWYAMLDRDWPQRRAAFEGWLDPGNFDETGRQRLRLSDLNATDLGVNDLSLRRADTTDLPALIDLQRAAYEPNRAILGGEPLPLRADYGAILHSHEVWLAQADGAVRGALILEPRPDHLLIWSVAILPAAQNQGLGRRLLAAAEVRARRLGLSELRLYTGERLTANVRWYHRRGYVIDRVEDLDDRRLVHMVKALGEGGGGGTA